MDDLTNIHKQSHRAALAAAKAARHRGPKHARLMRQAAVARFYFWQLRSLENR